MPEATRVTDGREDLLAASVGGPELDYAGPLVIGIDVGSTTVKAAVVEPATKDILWSDYRRHNTRQPEEVLAFLIQIGNAFPNVVREHIRIFMTGSGSGPIAPLVGAKYVQEVNAVTLAVERLHPDAGSVVELGGQDAKIVIFKVNKDTGARQAQTSMNDKCASGTGATIDKCMIKIGMAADEVATLHFADDKLHHVAAKCGVFAETDIVNLVKTGIPAPEIMCSLADAIVLQNLSVLARGNTLRHKVILLGGPNTYLPFLQECWRKRIPETWRGRGYSYPRDVPLDELIVVPRNAELYAAYGAVLFGLHEPAVVGRSAGLDALEEFIKHGRKTKLGEAAGPPLIEADAELTAFRERYRIPRFQPAAFTPGTRVRAVIGLDGGSTSSKCVLVDESGAILKKEYQLSKGNPIQDMREMLGRLKEYATEQGARLEVLGFGATGYAADVLEKALRVDVSVVETVAHMNSAVHFFGDADVICDIGGQDIKVLFMQNRELRNFKLSNQCSAGNGMLLQAMADQFRVPVTDFAECAFKAKLSPKFSYGCAVFLDSDRVNFQKDGYTKEELMAGLAMVLPKNVWQYVVQVPRLAELGRKFVLQGGTQHNLAAVKAQVDYITERVPGAEVCIHPHPGEAGAIGAAMEALRVVKRRGYSTFIGLDQAIDLTYTTRNDEQTRCRFCPNRCSRTFVDTTTPDGAAARYIAGFSCEKGTVEDEDALKHLHRQRREVMARYPNLVTYEAKRCFSPWFTPDPLPDAGSPVEYLQVKRGFLGGVRREMVRRGFQRSAEAAAARRQSLRIGIPRVLNLWSTGPFWRTYFEALGIPSHHVVFSDYTGEDMWKEGGKYGSVDPCFPSKVAQAHIHNLLFHKHTEQKPLHFIYFPAITHLPSGLDHVQDSASCPIVAGTPNVMRAAFTKETDFFAQRGIEYVDAAATMVEAHYLKRQMFETWSPRLAVTQDESDFAVDQAARALDTFSRDLEEKGRAILEQVEAENRMCLLLLCRPYHNDPGLNHGITEEFQAMGYPVISMRSIPKDRAWLHRFFEKDMEHGRIRSPLEITDVWPENYSANSAQKVWATKFAARNPHVAVLDLSSFKCGHDAPTYGIVQSIINTANTPYSALHDIDANKPAGSIKIRVKTYAYSLSLREEKLQDLGRKRVELERRIREKKLELIERKQRESQATTGCRNPGLDRELAALRPAPTGPGGSQGGHGA
jgi:activator of 2-hydroxyglutaryl-CoA dehydratase/predicted nucleotide-binding protein (sugar kinase/HSP70/actin superfamily)